MKALLVALAIVGCKTPDTELSYGPSPESCGSSECAGVSIPCDAVIDIRILRPSDRVAPLHTVCKELPPNRTRDLCAISSVDLADKPLEFPKETLEVQMLVWPRDVVLNEETSDPTDLDCGKRDVKFDAIAGFPINQQPTPALGGRTFYHPGDEEVRVTLGCTDLPALKGCSVNTSLTISAGVENFENLGVPVSVLEAGRLGVSVGEPTLEGAATVHTLNPANTRPLTLKVVGVVTLWQGEVDLSFVNAVCVQVLEDTPQATASVRCSTLGDIGSSELQVEGTVVPKGTLDQVLAALGTPFPPDGLTLGIVLDSQLNPAAGETVTAVAPSGTATIRYLNGSRTAFGGSSTSSSGIFVSTDAPFGTDFGVGAASRSIGGRIQGKVTVVVVQK